MPVENIELSVWASLQRTCSIILVTLGNIESIISKILHDFHVKSYLARRDGNLFTEPITGKLPVL